MIVDLKGEFYRLTSGWRATLGRVVLLDPRGHGTPYDPIAHLAGTEQGLRAAATIILNPEQDGKNNIFSNSALPLLVAMFRAAHLSGVPTLTHVARCVQERGLQGTVSELARLDDTMVAANLTLFLGARAAEVPEAAWSDSRWMPRQAWGTLCTRLRLVTWTLLQARIEAADEATGAPLIPLLLGLDETGVLPIPDLPHRVATMAGRGITAMIYVQSLAQLRAAYGDAGAQALLANCPTQIYHRTSAAETQAHVSQQAGRGTLLQRSRSTSQSEAGTGRQRSATESTSPRERPLLAPEDLRTLHEDNVVIFDRGRPLIAAARLRWFELSLLAARARRPAVPMRPRPVRILVPAAPPPAAPVELPAAPTGYTHLAIEDE